MKAAVAQIACSVGNVPANLKKIAEFCAAARDQGADLIVFPEMSDTGYSMPVIRDHAGPWDSGAVPQLQEIARGNELLLICGVSERAGDEIYNSQCVIDPGGKVSASYRKSHLFGLPPNNEKECFTPGDGLTNFDAGEFRFGLSICYDLRFPELFRALAVQNEVNVFVLSAAWPFPRAEHFRILPVARALENQSYLLAANRVGTDEGVTCCGGSAVIDPYGVTIAAASPDREELIFADLSAEVVNSARNRMPLFADRRADIYG